MLIHSIRLTDVLSFGPSSQELKLEPLNVLIGPNGSGKSNLIEAIGLLKAAPRDLHAPIRDGGGVRDWIWRGGTTGGIAHIEVVLPYGPKPAASLLIGIPGREPEVPGERGAAETRIS